MTEQDPGTRPKLLLPSIHDVGPRFEAEVDALADRLARRLDGPRFAMLVVPDHWGAAPLARAPRFAARLRAWADAGVEMFLHGWSHRDGTPPEGRAAGFKARHLTAGEGEFLSIDRAEATRRLRAGRAVVEDAIGRPVAGFVAPAWLYGPGARAALADERFAIAEDHFRVWRPADGAVLARGPVISWASRSPARIAGSIAFAGVARVALRRLPVVRVAVHPGDTRVPALLASIDRTIAAFADRRTGRYGDLMDTGTTARAPQRSGSPLPFRGGAGGGAAGTVELSSETSPTPTPPLKGRGLRPPSIGTKPRPGTIA